MSKEKAFRIKVVLYDAETGEFLGADVFHMRNGKQGFGADDARGWAKETLRRLNYNHFTDSQWEVTEN